MDKSEKIKDIMNRLGYSKDFNKYAINLELEVWKQAQKELLLNLINKANYLKEDSYFIDYIKSLYNDLL